jgi:hypothetical protein
MDRDYLLGIGELYHGALREQDLEVDKLTHELESTVAGVYRRLHEYAGADSGE